MTEEVHLVPPAGASKQEVEHVEKVLEDTQCGRKGSREPLRKLFDQYPGLTKIRGDMAALAEGMILNVLAKDDVLIKESQRHRLAAMRNDWSRPGDTELERLLVERAVVCWLAIYCAEMARWAKWEGGLSIESGDFWDRHVSKLNDDFLKACKTLALVRRLKRPAVAQINIADQQVNVAAANAR